LRIEQQVFAQHGLAPENFKQSGSLRVKGERRPLRVQPTDVDLAAGVDEHGPHITVAFTLPAGSFATVLLGELMKVEPAVGENAPVSEKSEESDRVEVTEE